MLPRTYGTLFCLHMSVAEYLLVVAVQSQCRVIAPFFCHGVTAFSIRTSAVGIAVEQEYVVDVTGASKDM
jgi:hypothetical protein